MSIGGSDSSSGAGIQGDLKTAMALGAWCHTVVSALTAQSPARIDRIYPSPPDSVTAQLEAVFSCSQGFSPQAAKVGMLGTRENVDAVATWLDTQPGLPLVIDTVFRATSGADLANEQVRAHLREKLMPRATLVTPNLLEAALLLDCRPAASVQEMHQHASALYDAGFAAVLLKGGHLPAGDQAVDILYSADGDQEFAAERIDTRHTHGSGCALATAIAVGLAKDLPLPEAIAMAKMQVKDFILRAHQVDFVDSNGPLIHF